MANEEYVAPRAEGGAPPLTDWKNEPECRNLKQDVESARPSQQAQMTLISNWRDLLSVKGKHRPKVVDGRSSVQPKLARRQAEWRYSALSEPFLGSNKLFKVSPVTFEDEASAKQNELVLNWQFRTKLNRVRFIDDYIRATVDEGTSIIRVGWKRTTVDVQEEHPVYEFYPVTDEQQLQMLQQALELRAEDLRGYDENVDPAIKASIDYYDETGEATVAVQVGTQPVTVTKVIENQPTVEVLNPENVFIDPSCNGELDKAMFVCVTFETSRAELIKHPERYKNLEYINWDGNSPVATPDHATSTPDDFSFSDRLRKKVVAYEYWGFYDIHGNGELKPIVATWIGDVLIRMEENPYPDEKVPFVLVPYMPVKRHLYGEPDAELLEDNQKIMGALTRGMIDLMGRSANAQIGFAKGMLDPLNRRKFEQGQDYEFNPANHPNNGLLEHKYPELPASVLNMLQLQNQEAEALTGVKSFGGGISGEAYGDVAAGIRGVLDAASKREMAILRRLAKGMTDIGNKIIAMNAVFLSDKEVIRVTNQEYVEILREDLQGNFDLETDIATAEIDNAKSQDLSFMLQTVGPNADPSIMMMILAEIADLKRMPALAQKLRNYRPQPSPEQQRLQELEIEKAEMEVAKLRSEVMLNEAKAQEAMSNKDKKDLDYVEQETGTTHAREMEKQRGQAQGNQALEVTKALTKPVKEGESRPNVEAAIGYNQLSSELNNPQPGSTIARDELAVADPRLSLGSSQFDPRQDPALNPATRI